MLHAHLDQTDAPDRHFPGRARKQITYPVTELTGR